MSEEMPRAEKRVVAAATRPSEADKLREHFGRMVPDHLIHTLTLVDIWLPGFKLQGQMHKAQALKLVARLQCLCGRSSPAKPSSPELQATMTQSRKGSRQSSQ